MSETAEDLQEGLRARAGRNGEINNGEISRFPASSDQEDYDVNEDEDEDTSYLYTKLFDMLKSDLLACDVQLSLFIAACESYRQDSTVRPFPPMYIVDGERDIESLLLAIRKLPKIAKILSTLEEGGALEVKILKLLVWVLSGGPLNLKIHSLDNEETLAALELADTGNHPKPSHVFAVTTNSTNRWISETEGKRTCWAYHGSRLDNFYSILNYGLQQHRTKVSLFGEGIYLSEDLGVCLAYSSRGVGWSRSMLGSSVSCMALAQVLDHPNVKVHSEDNERGSVEGSEGGRVPDKYIVVRNNELLHIRYLLVYKHSSAAASCISNSKLLTFANKHRMILLAVAYIGMLALIGMSKSVIVQRWLRKIGWAVD